MEKLDYTHAEITSFPDELTSLIRKALSHIGAVESKYTSDDGSGNPLSDKILFKFPGTPLRYHYVLWQNINSATGRLHFYSYRPTADEFSGSNSFDSPDTTKLADGSSKDGTDLAYNSYIQPELTKDDVYIAVGPSTFFITTKNSSNKLLIYELQDSNIVIKYSVNPNYTYHEFGTPSNDYGSYMQILGLTEYDHFSSYPVHTQDGSIPVFPAYCYTYNNIYMMFSIPSFFVSTKDVSCLTDYPVTYSGETFTLFGANYRDGFLGFAKGNEF